MGSAAATTQIKGIREGLLIAVADVPDWQRLLQADLAARQSFLQGSRVALSLGSRQLNAGELGELQAFIADQGLELWAVLSTAGATRRAAQDLGLATRLPGSATDLDGNILPAAAVPSATEDDGIISANGVVLRETLRSGRSIYHEGPVVIVGDVNPGAEIIAAGDVIVWGRLLGLVHAGALGDATAIVCALVLRPTQLRIADQIAISPAGPQRELLPEQAFIQAGHIVAEPWRLRSS